MGTKSAAGLLTSVESMFTTQEERDNAQRSCIIFSVFAGSPPTVDPNAAAASMVWGYIGELIFNMLILVGSVKMADRIVREMMGL